MFAPVRAGLFAALFAFACVLPVLPIHIAAAQTAERPFSRDDLDDAAVRLEAQIKTDSGQVTKPVAQLRREMEEAFKKNDFRGGLQLLGQIVSVEPDDAASWLRLARAVSQIRPANARERGRSSRMSYEDPGFWLAVFQIIWIDILLSGDNAVVIALACRKLPPRQRMWGIVLGTLVAISLRVIFTGMVTQLMTMPYVKLVGGVLLFWIAVKLLGGEENEKEIEAVDSLWKAIKIVAIADVVMSLDNIIAVAAAARGSRTCSSCRMRSMARASVLIRRRAATSIHPARGR